MQNTIGGKAEPYPAPRPPKGHKRPRVEVQLTDAERERIEHAIAHERSESATPDQVPTKIGPWIVRAALQAAEIIEGSCAPSSSAGERGDKRSPKLTPSVVPKVTSPYRPKPKVQANHAIEGPLRVACPSCSAKRGWPCKGEFGPVASPHQARIEKAADQAADKRTRSARKVKPYPQGVFGR